MGRANYARNLGSQVELSVSTHSLKRWQVSVEFPLGYLLAVLTPFGFFITQEEIKDMLAQGLGNQLTSLHGNDRLIQTAR